MITNFEKYTRLKRDLDRLQMEANKAEGVLEQLLSTLQKDHGCNDVEEAQALIQKLELQLGDMENDFEKSHKTFQRRWGPVIEALSQEG